MATNQPILSNGVAKCDTVERANGEYISIQHIVSYDDISDSVNVAVRVDEIALQHLGTGFEQLTA